MGTIYIKMRYSGLEYNTIAQLCSIHTSSDYLLRLPFGKGISEEFGSLIEDEVEKYDSKEKEYILCRQCRRIITTPAERIDVQGVHRHTFANPQGIIYEIGCFRAATGCVYAGPATREWSWFAGYSWRVAVCRTCLVHLGWLYLSNGNSAFHGLIMNRIIEHCIDRI